MRRHTEILHSNALLAKFVASDQLPSLDPPQDDRLRVLEQSIESAMQSGSPMTVQRICAEFVAVAQALTERLFAVAAKNISVYSERPQVYKWACVSSQNKNFGPPMKILTKIIAIIVACVILLLLLFSITGLDPQTRRAGLWLRGDVTSFPTDWSFADKYLTIMVETYPWYLLPHTVNIYFVTYQGNLYLHADNEPGDKFPSSKIWTSNVSRNPNVRLKLGHQVFDCKAVLDTDPADFNALFEIFRKKFPHSPYSNYSRRGDVHFFRVLPR